MKTEIAKTAESTDARAILLEKKRIAELRTRVLTRCLKLEAGTVTVIPGYLFNNPDRTTANIRVMAETLGLRSPDLSECAEIRDKKSSILAGVSDLVAMHVSIQDSGVDKSLLRLLGVSDGKTTPAYCGRPGFRWPETFYFAFMERE